MLFKLPQTAFVRQALVQRPAQLNSSKQADKRSRLSTQRNAPRYI